ncbi:hypothetical protein GCM10010329_82540 [Streptomyces spiroverticillatus]|uniref:Uncharacterized protein n=1 Tax=Streptomyces finlayi TaxID=67296 RepID=A0A918X9X5_9ACTN|nr:hypothetical protein [Streptomyces finlayi]GHA47560.1 hypothetical protein GCM10010329_82540 [Streptomyces spiroverticillatus]GHD18423.1 hypothetical protein GCM10010334_81260 [Streptomyces finlayi]
MKSLRRVSRYDVLQVLGLILLALGVQGAIRQLADYSDLGLLRWLPGGYEAALTGHVVAAVAGLALAAWATKRSKATTSAEAAGRQR